MKIFDSKRAHGRHGHMLIALAVFAVLYYLNTVYAWFVLPTDYFKLAQLAVVGLIYANMPDIDQPGSVINKWVTVALGAVIVYAFMNRTFQNFGIASAIILVLLRWIEHRTLIHSALGAAIVSAPLIYFGWLYFFVGLIAFITHIVSDNDFSFGWEKDHRI